MNGVSVFSASDGGQVVSAGNIINFFEDDFRTGQGESFSGAADFIRIHDDASTFGTAPSPVPLPAGFGLLLGALGALGLWRRKT